jgi:GNAT superfamily N-acetyltransferase
MARRSLLTTMAPWPSPTSGAVTSTTRQSAPCTPKCFDHPVLEDDDWKSQVERHSLGWVCAREGDEPVGFVNVAWDGRDPRLRARHHGPAGARRQGVGTELVAVAVKEARAAGCEWLHVDFEDHLRAFHFGACGFVPTTPDSSPCSDNDAVRLLERSMEDRCQASASGIPA